MDDCTETLFDTACSLPIDRENIQEEPDGFEGGIYTSYDNIEPLEVAEISISRESQDHSREPIVHFLRRVSKTI